MFGWHYNKNKPDPEKENLFLLLEMTQQLEKRWQEAFLPSQNDAPMRVCDHDDESRGDAKHQQQLRTHQTPLLQDEYINGHDQSIAII